MKYSFEEIVKQEFKNAFRGYKKEDVKVFIKNVADNLKSLSDENTRLKQNLEIAENQIKSTREINETIEQSIAKAKDLSEKTIDNAEKEKDLILKEAYLQSEKIVIEAQNKIKDLESAYINLVLEKKSLLIRIKNLLFASTSQLKTWEQEDLKNEIESFKKLKIDLSEISDSSKLQSKTEIEDIIKDLE